MNSYYCNDVALQLPNVQSVVDLTRHCLEIVTTDGSPFELVIERAKLKPDTTIEGIVESSLAERKRSLRGFEVASVTARSYPDVSGVEVLVTFIDKERGPLFQLEFHTAAGETRIAYLCSCKVAYAAECQQWMEAMLQELTLPDPPEE